MFYREVYEVLSEGKLGVHPPGALGVAFYVHTNADCFVGRHGDGITQTLIDAGSMLLDDHGAVRALSLRGRIFANLLEADAHGVMPELLLVCCNPSQVELFTADLTRFLENLVGRGRLRSVEDVRRSVPILVVLPNGIMAERMHRIYSEQIEQARLLDRLPGVTDEMARALLDRVVRGLSFQAGGRRGSGPKTVYILEPRGSITFAGGGDFEQARIESILTARGYPCNRVRGVPAARIEFDKAMISIVLNVGGLIHTVKPDGELIDLRMGDLCKDPTKDEFVGRITRAVFDVGQACGAYRADETYEAIWSVHRATILRFADHVTSSLKGFRDVLAAGVATVALMPNEEWILTPLCEYAARAGLQEEESLFRSLGQQVRQSMARAIKYRNQAPKNGRGERPMKLAAQRTFNIELYEAGANDVMLVGTMLDNEHLIKLELTINVPEEQITRSNLEMIRVPFPVCREVKAVAERLVGLRIQRGVLNEIAERVGGRVGCSHIKEIATNIVHFAASHLLRRRAGLDLDGIDAISVPPEERFRLTRRLLQDSCLAYCQTTSEGLDERIGIRRVGAEHSCPLPLGDYEASVGVLVRDRARRWGDKPFLRSRSGDGMATLTWNEFAHQVFQIARHLIEEGIRPGDRIAVISENRAEMMLLELAVMAIGAVSVPIFAGYHPPQIAYVLRHAQPRFVVVSGMHQLEKIERDRFAWIERYYCMDFNPKCAQWGALDFGQLTREGGAPAGRLDTRLEAVKPTDLALVMYTSGTTGQPKGVKLLHRNLISQQKAVSLVWDVNEKDVIMNYLPWHHSFGGLFERFMALYHGCELCLDDSRGRDLNRMLENWRLYRPTLFFSVPRVHAQLVAQSQEDSEVRRLMFDGRLRFVFTAAAPLSAQVEAVYREYGVPVLEGWGLTETSPCVTIRTKDQPWRTGYVGFPLPGVSVRIGSDQEILVKGPNVMEGYLDDEEATAHVIDQEGWFHTGDLGEFTKDGLRILGRKDGAFKLTTGEKVHPQRVETMLVNESPYIGTAVVVGSGKDYVGALIYPDFARLRQWARENGLAENNLTEHPRVHELYASEIERINNLIEPKYTRVRRAILSDREPSLERGELTPSAKIIRKAVVEAYKESLASLFDSNVAAGVIEVPELQLQKV